MDAAPFAKKPICCEEPIVESQNAATSEFSGYRSVGKVSTAELHRQIAELSAANKALEAFACAIAHDLQAPLRAIGMFSTLLLEDSDYTDQESRRYVERIQLANERMTQMIMSLLRMARHSKTELSRTKIDLSQLAREISTGLSHQANGREVIWEIESDLVAMVDPGLALVLLENLLGNAWKFTRHTSRARIEFGRAGPDFFVRDNGCGFDMAETSNLFQAFHRLPSAAGFEGSGIGLATVKRIVERHGGGIWADAKPGVGAIFRFRLG
jgi:signal transduction histidine kinase